MLYRVIDAVELPALVSAFMESYEVVAPVKRGGSHVFEVIQSPDDMDLSYATTIASPKKYFLPPVETLMTFDAQDNGVTDYAAEITPRVVFGAHACDINALNRLDLVFRDGRYPDPYYVARRAATLVVGVSCMPADTCFCHLWDGRGAFRLRSVPARHRRQVPREHSERRGGEHPRGRVQTRAWPPTPTASSSGTPRAAVRRRSTPTSPTSRTWPCSWTRSTATRSGRAGRALPCVHGVLGPCAPRASASTSKTRSTPTVRRAGASACGTRAPRPSSPRWRAGTTSAPTEGGRVRHRMYHKLNGFLANHDRMLCVGCGGA